jgi:hypothetical protein
MTEREWSQGWTSQQAEVDRLGGRGGWLPNIVERRRWGALRWTSGRPAHAAASGQAVAETFVVLRPDVSDAAAVDRVLDVLREAPPQVRIAGVGLHRRQILMALLGAVVGGLLLGILAAVLGLGVVLVAVAAVIGVLAGAIGGAVGAHYIDARRRAAVLGDAERVRVVTGRYAPESWTRLMKAATTLEERIRANDDTQSDEAMHVALWEAAGLLLNTSDHTGVEVLAQGVERLVKAYRP